MCRSERAPKHSVSKPAPTHSMRTDGLRREPRWARLTGVKTTRQNPRGKAMLMRRSTKSTRRGVVAGGRSRPATRLSGGPRSERTGGIPADLGLDHEVAVGSAVERNSHRVAAVAVVCNGAGPAREIRAGEPNGASGWTDSGGQRMIGDQGSGDWVNASKLEMSRSYSNASRGRRTSVGRARGFIERGRRLIQGAVGGQAWRVTDAAMTRKRPGCELQGRECR